MKKDEQTILDAGMDVVRRSSRSRETYERKNPSRPWEKIECKKPGSREVTSEVTKAQNSKLAIASQRAKAELSDPARRAEWEARYAVQRREWVKHRKPLKTLRMFVVGELMKG